jgi:hypothetical protein
MIRVFRGAILKGSERADFPVVRGLAVYDFPVTLHMGVAKPDGDNRPERQQVMSAPAIQAPRSAALHGRQFLPALHSHA